MLVAVVVVSGNASAFSLGKKTDPADAPETPCSKILGDIDVKLLIDVVDKMKSSCSNINKSTASAASAAKKLTVEAKTYSSSSDVSIVIFVNALLAFFGVYCDNMSSAYGLISNGVSKIKKAKKDGDSNEVAGIADLEHGFKMIRASSVCLMHFRAGIVLLYKFITGAKLKRVDNAGNLQTAVKKLRDQIVAPTKMIGKAQSVQITLDSLIERCEEISPSDKIEAIIENGKADLADTKSFIELFVSFLDAVVAQFGGDRSNLQVLSGSADAALKGGGQ
jgi:hypothetical protein